MKKKEKLVFHPSLGICEIIQHDPSNDHVTMVSTNGNQSVVPFSSFKKAGIRDIIDVKTANDLMHRIFHPVIESECINDLNNIIKRKNYTDYNLDHIVNIFIYLLNWKYCEHHSSVKHQECLTHIENTLCEELAFVLHLSKEDLITRMIQYYEQRTPTAS